MPGAHQLGEGQDEGREGGDVGLEGERGGGHHVALQQNASDAVLVLALPDGVKRVVVGADVAAHAVH